MATTPYDSRHMSSSSSFSWCMGRPSRTEQVEPHEEQKGTDLANVPLLHTANCMFAYNEHVRWVSTHAQASHSHTHSSSPLLVGVFRFSHQACATHSRIVVRCSPRRDSHALTATSVPATNTPPPPTPTLVTDVYIQFDCFDCPSVGHSDVSVLGSRHSTWQTILPARARGAFVCVYARNGAQPNVWCGVFSRDAVGAWAKAPFQYISLEPHAGVTRVNNQIPISKTHACSRCGEQVPKEHATSHRIRCESLGELGQKLQHEPRSRCPVCGHELHAKENHQHCVLCKKCVMNNDTRIERLGSCVCDKHITTTTTTTTTTAVDTFNTQSTSCERSKSPLAKRVLFT